MAARISQALTNEAKAKSGTPRSFMPGARSRMVVTMRFTAPTTEEMPSRRMARIQKSTARVLKSGEVSGA